MEPETILKALDESTGPISTDEYFPDISPGVVQAAVSALSSRDMILAKQIEKEVWVSTEEGAEIAKHGSHEMRLYQEVLKAVDGLAISEVPKRFGTSGKLGQQRAFKNGWVRNEGAKLVAATPSVEKDPTQEELRVVISGKSDTLDAKVLNELKKRRLISKVKKFWFEISKGPQFALSIPKLETELTIEMIQSGAWKTAQFKPYNFNAEGTNPDAGALHPLNKVREEFRHIFFNMGFAEMSTDPYVETGFWNFDALFVPQQHPARDLQDTFYIKNPAQGHLPQDKTYFDHVRNVHQDGEFGSIGYRYPWKESEATRLVLRTHTTATSARVLHDLAKTGPRSARYFSVDRVFRNEAVDATHLAEFHQIEGVIADFNLTLGDLIGFMQTFFSKMGVHQLRFKPAYNPYTEPSLEIFGYHNDLGKWVEIGNSGLFRPELLEPMGLPKDLRVIGFGLSLERPTMIKYGVSNIRELLGHKVSLDFIQSNPAVRFDESLV